MENIKIVAFDADDTLWRNEALFREGEATLCRLLADHAAADDIISELYGLETDTLKLYGYGIKGRMLSMIETALNISGGTVSPEIIAKILGIGKAQMEHPVEVYGGVHDVLGGLESEFRLVLATKGDLLDQQRKIGKSGLAGYFTHIEIMSEKHTANYRELLDKLGCGPEEFLMVGNSLRSDIVPVLELGGHAIHIPCETTWVHEEIDFELSHPNFTEAEKITEVPEILQNINVR